MGRNGDGHEALLMVCRWECEYCAAEFLSFSEAEEHEERDCPKRPSLEALSPPNDGGSVTATESPCAPPASSTPSAANGGMHANVEDLDTVDAALDAALTSAEK